MESWPEVSTFVQLTPRSRLYVIAGLTHDRGNEDTIQGQFGANIDLTLRPLVRRRLRTFDPAKNKLLVFRIGYRYLPTISGDGPSEQRIIAEITPRFPLFADIMASDRNRFDMRWVSGAEYSWRYRNRLTFERSFTIRSYSFTPYLHGEVYYDSRYQKINKEAYTIGAAFPISKHTEFESYFEDKYDHTTPPAFHVRGLGLVLNLYF